jgi:hypothetical protein
MRNAIGRRAAAGTLVAMQAPASASGATAEQGADR